MSIITFWNDSREQSGKTLTSIAVATRMAIERNSKILLISTSFDDPTMQNCFWGSEKKKNTGLFNPQNSTVAVENGIEGLLKLASSKKLEPSIITDYTRVIFKERLEVVAGFSTPQGRTLDDKINEIRKIEDYYIELIKIANQYYDVIIVDLDKKISIKTREEILKLSNVNVYVLSQKMDSIDRYNELRHGNSEFMKNRCIPVIGTYDNKFKYNSKNIARYLGDKKELNVLPRNLLFMGAAEEAGVVDLFLKLKNVKDKTDENYILMYCVLNLTNSILNKIQEMQMRLR